MEFEDDGDERKVVLITGASSGIGMTLAFEFIKTQDYITYASMRDPVAGKETFFRYMKEDFDENGVSMEEEEIQKLVKFVQLDVTEDKSVGDAVNTIMQNEGRIDVLINSAGIALVGFIETVSMEQIQKLFNVNFLGSVRVMQAVLPHMRSRHTGHIMTISSISAISAPNGLGFYGASKKALEALHESDAPILLSKWNIKMTLIEPGNVMSPTEHIVHKTMVGERKDYKETLELLEDGKKFDPYKEYIKKKSLGLYKIMLPFSGNSSTEVSKFIIDIIESEENHFRYQIGEDSTTLSKKKYGEIQKEIKH